MNGSKQNGTMSNPIGLLLADDSAVVRRVLSEAVEAEPRLTLVGTAKNGAEAVGLFPTCRPDVVLLDVEMPTMDGIEAVAAIRKLNSDVPILMFSSLTTKGGEATLDALMNGANDYVTKPTQVGHISEAVRHIQENLLPKVIAWGERYRAGKPTVYRRGPAVRSDLSPSLVTSNDNNVSNSAATPVDLVAVGVSTGGPDALSELVRGLPADLSVPILIVQHMPAVFTQLLADRLDQVCKLSVREARDSMLVEPGHIWIAPGGRHLRVIRQRDHLRLVLDDGPPENSCRPAVDVLFRSVAESVGNRALGIVMTGMGKDGLQGCQMLHQRGAKILVQDERTSVVWGMPGAVAQAGLTERAMSPGELASEIIRRAKPRSRNLVSTP